MQNAGEGDYICRLLVRGSKLRSHLARLTKGVVHVNTSARLSLFSRNISLQELSGAALINPNLRGKSRIYEKDAIVRRDNPLSGPCI